MLKKITSCTLSFTLALSIALTAPLAAHADSGGQQPQAINAYAEYLKEFLSDAGTDTAEYKFATRDIDGNGTDELLFLHLLPNDGSIFAGLTIYTFNTGVIKIPFPTREFENYKGEIQQYTPEQIDLFSNLDRVYTVGNADIPGVFYTISGIGGGSVMYVTVSDGKIEEKSIYDFEASSLYPEDANESVDDPALYAAYQSNSKEINWYLLNTETLATIFNDQNEPPSATTERSVPSSWAQSAVDTAKSFGLANADLTNGYQATTTRAEFCRAAVNFLRKYGYDVDSVTPKMFEDTSDRDIGIAAALKITNGSNTAGTQFSPDNPLTREQAATMLLNVLNVIDVSYNNAPVAWTDKPDVSEWAVEGVNVLYNAKIMGGTSETALVFSPQTPYTHEQSIVTLVNLWNFVQQ